MAASVDAGREPARSSTASTSGMFPASAPRSPTGRLSTPGSAPTPAWSVRAAPSTGPSGSPSAWGAEARSATHRPRPADGRLDGRRTRSCISGPEQRKASALHSAFVAGSEGDRHSVRAAAGEGLTVAQPLGRTRRAGAVARGEVLGPAGRHKSRTLRHVAGDHYPVFSPGRPRTSRGDEGRADPDPQERGLVGDGAGPAARAHSIRSRDRVGVRSRVGGDHPTAQHHATEVLIEV
jgi:hypothetical protein